MEETTAAMTVINAALGREIVTLIKIVILVSHAGSTTALVLRLKQTMTAVIQVNIQFIFQSNFMCYAYVCFKCLDQGGLLDATGGDSLH